MMRKWNGFLVAMLFVATPLIAQTTRPLDQQSAINLIAQEAFTRGQYATALPLLEKLAIQLKGQPDQLEPIQEQIRVCQRNLGANPQPAPVIPPTGANPGDPPMTAATRIPHPKPAAGQVQTMSIKELGNFEYDPDKGGGIPKDVYGLSGSDIKLTGFMIPMDSADRITQFALVPSLFACCFGQPPQIQHTIVVNCPTGKAVAYYPDQISVEGTLKVDEQKEDGFIVSIFQLKAQSIRPAQ
ncbi:MAG TPA: DUF3299 domain-containing protein [Tepidisphaeraceae bacterium]|jgi:hypothetical protein